MISATFEICTIAVTTCYCSMFIFSTNPSVEFGQLNKMETVQNIYCMMETERNTECRHNLFRIKKEKKKRN